MRTWIRALVSGAAAVVMMAPAAEAQSPPDALKVQVVVTRQQGEKKVSSLPHTLSVIAGDNRGTSLRSGVNMPLPARDGAGHSYQMVGTVIDCTAGSSVAGVYRLTMTVSDTAVYVPNPDAPDAPSSRIGSVPALRNFSSSFGVLLRDGQTAQHVTATDPITGEALKLDVTLSVVK